MHKIDRNAGSDNEAGSSVPPVLAVVGENRDDPDCLLLLGDDGTHYRYHILDGTTTPVTLDDAWIVDTHASTHANTGSFAAPDRPHHSSVAA